MRLLLDTHVLLWWLSDVGELSLEAKGAIAEARNLVYVSAVTIWEIVVKRALGKLELPDDWSDVVERESFRQLPVTWSHALALRELPDLHRDPFDRLLVAQAIAEDLTIVTHDEAIRRYAVRSLPT